MKLLLDTHVLLWAAGEPGKLPEAARSLLTDERNRLYFSAASVWEVVIKGGLGRDDLRVDPVRLRRLLVLNGYDEVPITADHALAVRELPPLHRDPFDRVFLAQARVEGMGLVTVDEQVARYGGGVLSV